jgi:hypothetical protein
MRFQPRIFVLTMGTNYGGGVIMAIESTGGSVEQGNGDLMDRGLVRVIPTNA